MVTGASDIILIEIVAPFELTLDECEMVLKMKLQ